MNPKGGTNKSLGAYSPTVGYGFADTGAVTLSTAVTGRNDNTQLTPPDNDYAVLGAGTQFIVDLPASLYPNGTFDIYYTAAYYASGNSVKLTAEGGSTVYSVSNGANQAKTGVITGVKVTDGQLNLAFQSLSRITQLVIRYVPADKTALNAAIFSTQGMNLVQSNYTVSPWNTLQTALAAANTCPADTQQADVDTLTQNLTNAVKGLVSAAALNAAVASAQSLKQPDYTSGSWKALQTALAATAGYPDSASQADIDTLTQNLSNAVKGLVNVTALNAAVASAQSLKQPDYTSGSWKTLQTALAAAAGYPGSASQADIDTLTQNLSNAVKGLVSAAALNAAIGNALRLKLGDYTVMSVLNLLKSLIPALLCPPNASQAQVDMLTADLNQATTQMQYRHFPWWCILWRD